jgi:hypothetical protein
MSIAPNDTHAVVISVLTDLVLAMHTGNTGCFALEEVVAFEEALNVVAVRALPETEYHRNAWTLLSEMLQLAHSRKASAVAACPLASKLRHAMGRLEACRPTG